MKTVGVIVGRFQTPRLHEGHRSLIENVMARHDEVLIVLGTTSAQLTRDNPLDYATRAAMIRGAYPNVAVTDIHDVPSDKQWSEMLDGILDTLYPTHTPILYGNRDSFVLSYVGRYEYRKLSETVNASATDIRKQIIEPLDNDYFRAGIIYASRNRYPTSYQTVDVAVIDKGRVLLGQKNEDDGKFRFIGGFVDPQDATLEAAARREVGEETTKMEVADYKFLGSARIDDRRYRGTEDGILSAFFIAKYIFGSPTAADDLDNVEWVSIAAMMGNLVPHHRVLGEMLLDHLRKEAS